MKKSRDAAAKKSKYKRSRDKQYEETYIPLTTTPTNHTHRFHPYVRHFGAKGAQAIIIQLSWKWRCVVDATEPASVEGVPA